jgi:hypothetical protein
MRLPAKYSTIYFPSFTKQTRIVYIHLLFCSYLSITHQPAIMLLSYLLVTLASTTSSLPTAVEPYNCGYVLTLHNSSAYAGVYAYDSCKPIYFNQTIQDYQDAYAYHMFGGCKCKFFG